VKQHNYLRVFLWMGGFFLEIVHRELNQQPLEHFGPEIHSQIRWSLELILK